MSEGQKQSFYFRLDEEHRIIKINEKICINECFGDIKQPLQEFYQIYKQT